MSCSCTWSIYIELSGSVPLWLALKGFASRIFETAVLAREEKMNTKKSSQVIAAVSFPELIEMGKREKSTQSLRDLTAT